MNCFCPKCHKRIRYEDIQLLFWDTTTPVLDVEIVKLQEAAQRLAHDNENLTRQLEQLNAKVKIGREQLAKSVIPMMQVRDVEVEKATISMPSIVFEKKMNEGYRLCTCYGSLVASDKVGDAFGVEVIPMMSTFTTSTFIPIHAAKIHEITDLGTRSRVVTVGHDKTLADVSLEACEVIHKYSFDTGLWCCTAMSDNVVVAGGMMGKLFSVDTRAQEMTCLRESKGMPLFSIAKLNDTMIMAMNPKECFIFDVRKGEIVQNSQRDVSGGFFVTGTRNSDIYSVISRNEREAEALFCSFSQQTNKFSTFAKIPIGKLEIMAHSSVDVIDRIVHIAVPNNRPCGFSLHAMSQPHNDVWCEFASRWDRYSKSGPANDLSLTHTTESIVLAAVTTNTLTMYEIPFFQ